MNIDLMEKVELERIVELRLMKAFQGRPFSCVKKDTEELFVLQHENGADIISCPLQPILDNLSSAVFHDKQVKPMLRVLDMNAYPERLKRTAGISVELAHLIVAETRANKD